MFIKFAVPSTGVRCISVKCTPEQSIHLPAVSSTRNRDEVSLTEDH